MRPFARCRLVGEAIVGDRHLVERAADVGGAAAAREAAALDGTGAEGGGIVVCQSVTAERKKGEVPAAFLQPPRAPHTAVVQLHGAASTSANKPMLKFRF
jgi:hypothetical protein